MGIMILNGKDERNTKFEGNFMLAQDLIALRLEQHTARVQLSLHKVGI